MGGGPTQGVILRDTSGEAVIVTSGRLLVDLSGTTITASVSLSGQPVYLVSGNNSIQISGQTINSFEHGSSLLTADTTVVPSLSGGVFLGSGAVFSVSIRSISGNAPVWIGGATGSNVPFSGHGRLMYHSDNPFELKVDDVGDIKVFAETSGQKVSWLGTVK